VIMYVSNREYPGAPGVSVAAIRGIVPMNRIGLDVGLLDPERRLLPLEPFLDLSGGFVHQSSHDHRRARGNRRAGVGNERRVLRGQEHSLQTNTQGICGELTKDGLGALADLRRCREDPERAIRERLESDGALKFFLSA